MAYTIVPVIRKNKAVFCVVMHGDALKRIRQHDPAVAEGTTLLQALTGKLRAPIRQSLLHLFSVPNVPLSLVDVMVAYEENAEEFAAKCKELNSAEAILKYLGRNGENKPEDTNELTKVATVKP